MVLLSSSMQSCSSFSVWAGWFHLGLFFWRGVSGSCRMHLGCESAKLLSGAWVYMRCRDIGYWFNVWRHAACVMLSSRVR